MHLFCCGNAVKSLLSKKSITLVFKKCTENLTPHLVTFHVLKSIHLVLKLYFIWACGSSTLWSQFTLLQKASLIDRRCQRSASAVLRLYSTFFAVPSGTWLLQQHTGSAARPLEKWHQQWNWTPVRKFPSWDWGHGRCVYFLFYMLS